MEKWTRGIWRKRRRGCSISGVQWWIDSGLEKPHLADCFQKHSFAHVQWHYAFQTSSVFLLSKDAAYYKCSQNACQGREKGRSCECATWLRFVWTCFANLSRTLECIYTCSVYVWVSFLLLFVRFTWWSLSPAINELGFAIAGIVFIPLLNAIFYSQHIV